MMRSLVFIGVMTAIIGCGTQKHNQKETTALPNNSVTKSAKKPDALKDNDPWANASLIKAPAPAPARALRLPVLKRFKTKTGLAVLAASDESLPLIRVAITMNMGAVNDPADKVGLADYTAMMLRQGVKGMSAEKISEVLDEAALQLNISPGYELSTLSCSGRSNKLDLCLSILAKLVTQPSFPKKEMPQIAKQLEADVRSTLDNPPSLAAKHFYNLLYGDNHPLGRPMTLASIKAITQKDLKTFFKRYYNPKHAILSLAGKLDANYETLIKKHFKRWKARPSKRVKTPPLKRIGKGMRVLLVDKPDLTQSSFMLGHEGVRLRDPNRDALRIANYVLGGGGFSSRLMKRVRSEGGKTYGIGSAFYSHEDDGLFRITSSTRNEELVNTLKLVQDELSKFISHPPTQEEINRTLGKVSGGYTIRYKTIASLVNALAETELRKLGDRYVSELPLRLSKLTKNDIAEASRAFIHPDNLLVTVVGKASVVSKLLKKANIPFTQISYLDPISEKSRHSKKTKIKISPKEKKDAQTIALRAIRAAGGKKAISAIKSLRAKGIMTRQTRFGKMTSKMEISIVDPDYIRITSFLGGAAAQGKPPLRLEQILNGDKGIMIAQGKGQALPSHVIVALKGAIYRHPALVLKRLLSKNALIRPTKENIAKTQIGIDLFSENHNAISLIFDRKSYHLVEMIQKKNAGDSQKIIFSAHKKTKKIIIPYKQNAQNGSVELEYETIEINPAIKRFQQK